MNCVVAPYTPGAAACTAPTGLAVFAGDRSQHITGGGAQGYTGRRHPGPLPALALAQGVNCLLPQRVDTSGPVPPASGPNSGTSGDGPHTGGGK